jgi:hypothetical protein
MKSRFSGFLTLVAVIGVSFTRQAGAQPVIRTIPGNPLTIRIGSDTSMQVVDGRSDFAPGPVFFPECVPSGTATGDAGVLVRVGGVLYGPDFPSHPCGTQLNGLAVTPWTAVSIGNVTGLGTSENPFELVIVADAGSSGLRLTETVQYVNGAGQVRPILSFSNVGSASLAWDTFLAVNVGFLAFPILELGRPGLQYAFKLGAPFPACAPLMYRILLPAADRYSAQLTTDSWLEIQSGDLSNTLYGGCPSSGAATEWVGRSLAPGQTLVLSPNSGISFLASGAATASVPATSATGTAILAAGLVLAGWLALSRREAV